MYLLSFLLLMLTNRQTLLAHYKEDSVRPKRFCFILLTFSKYFFFLFSKNISLFDFSAPTVEQLQQAAPTPESFDWRNVNGTNYVSPVRNQGKCGSCYAFSSMAMLESRIRVLTNNRKKPVLSTQNIVSCSNYSQGCEGGKIFLMHRSRVRASSRACVYGQNHLTC